MTGVDMAAGSGSRAVSPGRRRGHRQRRKIVVAVVAVVAAAVAGTVVALTARGARTAIPPGCTVVGTANRQYTVNLDQAQNAAIIAAVAYKGRLPDHAVTVALAAALQESKLFNLPYGDLDSVGLFQQRPSQGWGTQAQLEDPTYASSAFYRRLVQIPGWQGLPVSEAAQSVQLSAAPSAYAGWEDEARALAVGLTGERPAGFTCHLNGFDGAAPALAALGQALSGEMGAPLLGVPVDSKTGWQVASWAVAHAYNYHLLSVSFSRQTWRSSSGKWASGAGPMDPGVVTVSVG